LIEVFFFRILVTTKMVITASRPPKASKLLSW